MAQVVRGGEAGGALESVLVELEPLVTVSGMVASSRMGRDWGLVLTILMGAASFKHDCCMQGVAESDRCCVRQGVKRLIILSFGGHMKTIPNIFWSNLVI